MIASPIMTLFREFEVKYRQAGDMSFEEEIASGLLDECKSLEKRMKAIPSSSAQDFAAKIIVETRYGDFVLDDPGEAADDQARNELHNRRDQKGSKRRISMSAD